ncbi:MAG TPA: hypothetical protein VKF61_11935 [Candidatus Polarisedimenticolia bacterium]|nr:hypothetical protein [Candidatus Polarisedimenticolia bacterium]
MREADREDERETSEESGRLRAAIDDLRGLLVQGERLEVYAVQRRLFALLHRRLIVGATTGRLILLQRGLIGGFAPQDIRWQDLKDARLTVGVFGSDILLTAGRGGDLAVADQGIQMVALTGLRKDQAAAVYRICQAQEQAWREKRRVREIEEIRARSGGIAIGSAAGTAEGAALGLGDGYPAQRLQRAREMLQRGLITDSEYESIKAKIVSGL